MDEVDNSLNGTDDAVGEQQLFWGHTLEKYLYMLPKGKDYIKENTRLINEWLVESQIRESVMHTLHLMPSLLLQKPSKSSKSKDQVDALK